MKSPTKTLQEEIQRVKELMEYTSDTAIMQVSISLAEKALTLNSKKHILAAINTLKQIS